MSRSSDAYDGQCPTCGHVFTLADLKRMAVGDGWQRWIMVSMPDGTRQPVRFDDFDPQTMAVEIGGEPFPRP
jgi:hypothetical protein